MRNDVGHASGCSGSRPQSSREVVLEFHVVFVICRCLIVSCSGCGGKFRPETLCMGWMKRLFVSG